MYAYMYIHIFKRRKTFILQMSKLLPCLRSVSRPLLPAHWRILAFFPILVPRRGSWKMCSSKFTCLWKAGVVSSVSVVPCTMHCSDSYSLPILPSEAASANHRPNLGEVKYKFQTTMESRARVWTQTRDLSGFFPISLLAATNAQG